MALANSGGGGASAGAVRAGKAFVEIGIDRTPLERGLKQVQARLASFAKTAFNVGLGGVGIGTGILAPLVAAGKFAVDRGASFERLSQRLGDTTENLSGLAYAAETTGQTLEDLEGHFENLAERIVQAAEGGGEAVETFKKLRIDPNQLKLIPAAEQMEILADAVNAFSDNDTVRRGLLSTLGGDKFQGLNELFKKGSVGIRNLKKEAANVGATVGTAEAKEADLAWQSLNRAWAAAKGVLASVGAALIPHAETIKSISSGVVGAVVSVRAWVNENRILVAGLAAVGVGLIAGGAALAALGVVAGVVSSGVGALAAVVGFLASPVAVTAAGIAVLTAALAGVGYKLLTTTESGRAFAAELSGGIAEAAAIAKQTVGGIADAFKAGDLALAGKIAMVGLYAVMTDAVVWMTQKWNGFKTVFVDGWHEGVKQAKLVLFDFGSWIEDLFLKAFRLLFDKFHETFVRVLKFASPILSKLGDAETAGALDVIAAAPKDQVLDAIDKVAGAKPEERANEKAKIIRDAENEQRQRDKDRKKDEEVAKKDAQDARDALAELNRRAREAAINAAGDGGLAKGAKGLAGVGVIPSRAQIGDSVKGALGGAFTRQQFGFGDKVAEKQLNAQLQAAAGIKGVNEKLDELPGKLGGEIMKGFVLN